jgi:hypothetical protein
MPKLTLKSKAKRYDRIFIWPATKERLVKLAHRRKETMALLIDNLSKI